MPGQSGNGGRVSHHDSALKALEAGDSALVESYDLGVQNRFSRLHAMRQNRELGILTVHRIAFARNQAQLAVLDVAEGANAVPFDLVQPLFVRGRSPAADLRQHGGDRLGHRVLWRSRWPVAG